MLQTILLVFISVHVVQPLSWSTWVGSGLSPRILAGSAVKPDTFFVLGGYAELAPSLILASGTLERWQTTPTYSVSVGSSVLPNGTYAGCATYFAADNRVYLAGGRIGESNLTTSRIVSVDAAGGTGYVEIFPPVTIGEYLSCTLDNADCINIFGGNPNPTTHLIYCPLSSTWITNSSLPVPLFQHGSLKAYDGRIYVFGGVGSDGYPQNTTYIFDPSNYQWTIGPPMLDRLAGFAYSATPDGSYFFVIGGFNYTLQNVDSVYKFDVIQQIWTKDSTNYPYAIRYGSSQVDNNNVFVIDGQLSNGSFVAARYMALIPASPSPSVTPSNTPTPSVTTSPSVTPSITPTSSPSQTPSSSPSVSPTASVTPSPSPTTSPTPSITPSSSVTPSPSATPSISPSVSVGPSYSLLPASASPNNGMGKKDSTAIIAGAVGGGVVVGLAILGGIIFVAIRKKNNNGYIQSSANPPPKSPSADIEMQGTTYAPINLTPQNSSHYDSAGSIHLSNGSTGSNPERPRSNSSKIKALLNKQNDWILSFAELELGKRIGAGAFGEVYRASWRGIDVAVKKMRINDSNDNESDNEAEVDIQQFFAEAELMKKLRPHSNITQLFGVCAHPLCIVTEYVPNGNLSSWLLNQTREIDVTAKIRIARGIAAGMLHLHSEGVIHRDLAARNILLDANLNPKVSDFGMSRLSLEGQSNITESNIGPIKWMAPEALLEQVYNKKTDVWSYGVVLYEILTRKLPYENQNLVQTANLVSLGKLNLIEEVVANESSYPPAIVNTMKACLQFDPNERPEFSDIVKMLQPSD